MLSHSYFNKNVRDQNEIFYNSNFSQKRVRSSENQPFVDSSSLKNFETVST